MLTTSLRIHIEEMIRRKHSMNGSEIARLREVIELEYRAAQRGLEGNAITSSHLFIHERLARIAQCHTELQKYVGERAATEIVLEVQYHVVS
jgi:hypothetical protein